MEKELTILPDSGWISIDDLALMMGTTPQTIVSKLSEQGVKFVKLSSYKKHWLVNLAKLDENI